MHVVLVKNLLRAAEIDIAELPHLTHATVASSRSPASRPLHFRPPTIILHHYQPQCCNENSAYSGWNFFLLPNKDTGMCEVLE
jgi:hypothetical protein